MTDNEIIKALECCSGDTLDDCEGCPRFIYDDVSTVGCMCKLMRDTLDLINCQKAEIEEQREINESLKADRPFIIAEAVKEFAERLCEDWRKDEDEMLCDVDIVKWILDIYKEMVGAESG